MKDQSLDNVSQNEGYGKSLGRYFFLLLIALCTLFLFNGDNQAQVGGEFAIEQKVIGGGGGGAAGGVFVLDWTSGQPVAGNALQGSFFGVTSGFWNFPPPVPPSEAVTISGKVLRPNGKGINRAEVIITDLSGNTRTTLTDHLGEYCFDNVEVGQPYTLVPYVKQYLFIAQTIVVSEATNGIDFIAIDRR